MLKFLSTALLVIGFFMNSISQGYYSFSDKLNGEFSDEGKFSINIHAGAGIPIASTFGAELEYGIKNSGISVGVSALRQNYSREVIFDFQGGVNYLAHIYGKYTLYPKNGRLSFHGALGGGIQINNDTYYSPYQTLSTKSFSYLILAGTKYRISKVIGVRAQVYYSIEPCIVGGISISL